MPRASIARISIYQGIANEAVEERDDVERAASERAAGGSGRLDHAQSHRPFVYLFPWPARSNRAAAPSIEAAVSEKPAAVQYTQFFWARVVD